VIIASSQGGVDIESVAANSPDAIIKSPINIFNGFLLKYTSVFLYI
jgi:succinyl-CoA synthetase beta subunit